MGFLALFSLVAALPLLFPFASAASLPSPAFVRPIPEFALAAGTFQDHALNLTDYFSPPLSGDYDYWTVRLGSTQDSYPAGVAVRVEGQWLQVAAPDIGWVGTVNYTLEACTVRGEDRACTLSNSFAIRVLVPGSLPSDPAPGAEPVAVPTISGGSDGKSAQFTATFPPSSDLRGLPRWFVDNQFAGEGYSVELSGLEPGIHRVYILFETQSGPGSASREFQIAAEGSGAIPLWALSLAGAALFGLAAVPARTRGFLLLSIVGALYPRLKEESLLDHFNRGALHQVIKENPGIHFGELRKRVGISHGTAIYHLRILQGGGYIRGLSVGAYSTYYSTGQSLEPETYGLSPPDRAVLDLVSGAPGIALRDLARRSNRSLGTTSRTVSRLASLGFVTTQRARRRLLVYPRERNAPQPTHPEPASALSP